MLLHISQLWTEAVLHILTLFIRLAYPIHFDTISMELSILYFKGLPMEVFIKCIDIYFLSLKIVFILANSAYPDEMPPHLSSLFANSGSVAQLVTCLATDASLTTDPGVVSSIPAWYHTFLDINHEIITTVILRPSAESFKKGCCQLLAKVCARSTG